METLTCFKKYLYDTILRSLRSFEGEKSVHQKVLRLVSEAEILYNKALINETRKALSKARKLAYRTEEFQGLLSIIEFEKRITGVHRYKNLDKALQKLMQEEKVVLDKLQNVNILQTNYYHVFALIKKDRMLSNKKHALDLNRIMQNPIYSDLDNADSFRAKVIYFSTFTFYLELKGEYEEGFKYSSSLIDLWNSHPNNIKEQPDKYLASNVNFLNRCFRLNKLKEMRKTLDRLNALSASSLKMEVALFEVVHHFELIYHSIQLDFKASDIIIDRLLNGLEQYGTMIKNNYRILFYFNISSHRLRQENYGDVLEFTGKLIALEKQDVQRDAYRFALLMNLLAHFELKNIEVLLYSVKSVKRQFELEDSLSEFDQLFLSFLLKSSKVYSVYGKQKELYQEYYEKFIELSKNPKENKAFQYIELLPWFESKISRKPITEILKQDAIKVNSN